MKDLLYIGGGIAVGWIIGKMIFGDDRIRSNVSKPKRPDDPDPTAEQLISSLPSFDPDDPKSLDPINRLKVVQPNFVEDVVLWSTASPDHILVFFKDRPIGVIEKEGNKYNAFFPSYGGNQVVLVKKTSRKKAIGAIYTAAALFALLSQRRGSVDNAEDLADMLGIPMPLVIDIGQTLARGGKYGPYIFGIFREELVEPTIQQEKVLTLGMAPVSDDPALRERQRKELALAKKRQRRGRKRKIEHKKRRLVYKPDIAALRESEVLTKKQKEALPEPTLVKRYSFGLFAPVGSRNIVGMHGTGTLALQEKISEEDLEAFQQTLELSRRQKDLEAFERILERRTQEEIEEQEARAEQRRLGKQRSLEELEILFEDRPFHKIREEALRKLFLDPAEFPDDAFFEGLEWFSEQYKARKLAAMRTYIDELRDKLEFATQRVEAAQRSGDEERELNAHTYQTQIQDELDKMLEKLARAQKALSEKK